MDAKPKIAFVTATQAYHAKDSEVLSDNSVTENTYIGDLMSLRCQKGTQSLSTSVSMDAKPKLAYVTAAKPPGGGLEYRKRWGCSSIILKLTPQGDQSGRGSRIF